MQLLHVILGSDMNIMTKDTILQYLLGTRWEFDELDKAIEESSGKSVTIKD